MLNDKTVRATVAAILAGCIASTYAISAEAQVAAPSGPAAEEELEEAVVTGSSLKRIDAEDALPVTVLGEDAMNLRDATTPIEMLTSLPQLTSVPANEQPRGGAGARGDVSTIAMRGLSASDTLVLLNGRRLIAHPTSEGAQFAPNVNQLPTQGLARIEVLRDGASSIYGSDAVAGVVNYITDRDFRGAKGSVRFGMPEDGGGTNEQISLTLGTDFASGRGRVMANFDFFNRNAIYARDRKWASTTDQTSRAPAPWDGSVSSARSAFDLRPNNGVYVRFTDPITNATRTFRPLDGSMAITAVPAKTSTDPDDLAFYSDAADTNMLLGDSRRYNLFGSAEFDLTDNVTAFGDLSYYNAHSSIVRAPVAMTFPSPDAAQVLPADNPYNPYGTSFYAVDGDGVTRLAGTPRDVTLLSLNPNPNQNEYTIVNSDTYRAVAGLRGKLIKDWTWETGLLYSYGKVSDSNPYSIRDSGLWAALHQTDPATAYNPFGYKFKIQDGAVVVDQPYTNPDSVIDSFTDEWIRYGESTLKSFDARLSGSIWSIWGGDIQASVGTELRKESYKDWRPEYAGMNPAESYTDENGFYFDSNGNDFAPASPKPDAGGGRNVKSLFAEVVVPLVAPGNGVPLINTLELTGSVRYEDYSDFGTTTNPKFGINYRPVRGVMVRASYNQGFTAPALPLLYNAAQWSYAGSGQPDPYRSVVTAESNYPQRSGSAGNPDLQPTDSVGKSVGVVFEVPHMSGLSLSADFWQIKQTNMIASSSAVAARNNDAALLAAYALQQLNSGVPLANIASLDAGRGETGNVLDTAAQASYKGDPAVFRRAVTDEDLALFQAYNFAHPEAPMVAVGQIFQVNTPTLNMGEGIVEGWDFTLNYTRSLPIGKISFNSEWTYNTKSNWTQNIPGGEPIYNERLGVNGVAKWRGSTTLAWRNGPWAGGLSAYYIGSFADTGASTTSTIYEELDQPGYILPVFTSGSTQYYYKIDSVTYYNGFGSYTFGADTESFLADTSIRFGVNNLTDKKPPVAPGNFGFGYNVSAHGSLVAGRTWTVEFARKF